MSTRTSSRRVRANRRNARRSTGPRTSAGKRRSSGNATSHGIYCKDLVLPGESNAEFQAFRDAYLLRLNPQDVLELLIVDRVVAGAWKLRRLQSAEPYIHAAEAQDMRNSEQEQRQQLEEDLIEHQRNLGGDPREVEAMLDEAEARPAHERFAAAATLAVSLIKGDGGFERLTRIEQRLERSIHRNLEELRKLRKLDDEVTSLQPSLRPCPFIADEPGERPAEPQASQVVAEPETPTKPIVQNEPIGDAKSQEHAAGASQTRAEDGPISRSTGTPRVGDPCHEQKAAAPGIGYPRDNPADEAAQQRWVYRASPWPGMLKRKRMARR